MPITEGRFSKSETVMDALVVSSLTDDGKHFETFKRHPIMHFFLLNSE